MSLLLLALLLGAGGPSYDEASRIAYVRQALGIVTETEATVLAQTYDYVSQMERNACNAQYDRLRVECLMAASRRWCKARKGKVDPGACVVWSDVVVTAALAEKQLVPAAEASLAEAMRRIERANERERALAAAARTFLDGDWHAGCRQLDGVLA